MITSIGIFENKETTDENAEDDAEAFILKMKLYMSFLKKPSSSSWSL
jgi:hypothetical protein